MPIVNLNKYSGVYKGLPIYSYTGKSQWIDDGNDNWRLKLLTSGTLTITKPNSANKVDLFLVGGGNEGDGGVPGTNLGWGNGGDGGAGGECVTKKDVKLKKALYTIVIGGSDRPTSMHLNEMLLAIAKNGQGGYGGNGGAGKPPTDGGNGGYGFSEFGDPSAQKYGGGGGGGKRQGHAGLGRDGGGNSGVDGTPNTGGGGGGGNYGYNSAHAGGKGGSGILIIRNHRE